MLAKASQNIVQIHQHMHDAVEHDRKVHVAVEVFFPVIVGGRGEGEARAGS